MGDLEAFFAAHALKVWSPGLVTDCCLALADWAVACGHPDPAAHLRGAYDSDEGFRAIIEAAGSMTALVGSCAAAIGARRLQEPIRGAIGVIGSATNIHRQFGAIHDGAGWRVRFVDGFSPMVARPLAIWAIRSASSVHDHATSGGFAPGRGRWAFEPKLVHGALQEAAARDVALAATAID